MISMLRIKYLQFLEHRRQEGWLSACRFTFYKHEEAVPVEKDLTALRPVKAPAGGTPELVEIGPENFLCLPLTYLLRSRRERAGRYFALGYRSFAMVRDGKVLGDLWYVTRQSGRFDPPHPHLGWFGIDLGPRQAYMFDMWVDPGERGNALTTWFLGSVLHEQRRRGLEKVYGYFAAQNVPALWVHRLIGYQELPRFIVRRFLLYETARAKN